jgi:hypothetical protein
LLAAVTGFWLVQSQRAVSVLPQPVPISVGDFHSGHVQLDNGSSSTVHRVLTPAGPQRNLPPAPSHSLASSSWWSPLPDSSDTLPNSSSTVWYRAGEAHFPAPATARAPAAGLAGHDLLTQFCVNRR